MGIAMSKRALFVAAILSSLSVSAFANTRPVSGQCNVKLFYTDSKVLGNWSFREVRMIQNIQANSNEFAFSVPDTHYKLRLKLNFYQRSSNASGAGDFTIMTLVWAEQIPGSAERFIYSGGSKSVQSDQQLITVRDFENADFVNQLTKLGFSSSEAIDLSTNGTDDFKKLLVQGKVQNDFVASVQASCVVR